MTTKKHYYIDYFLLLLLVLLSGVPYFVNETLYVICFVLLLLSFINRKKKIDSLFVYFILITLLLLIAIGIKFRYFPVITNMGLLIKLFSAYFIVKVLEDRFLITYIKILYYIAILSLVIYFFILFVPEINAFLINTLVPFFNILNPSNDSTFILFYTFAYAGEFRNTGPFWEPGAFGGYLIIAYIFNYLYYNRLFNKTGIVFLITILSTFSTTTYLGLFVFLFFMLLAKSQTYYLKILAITVSIIAGIFMFNNLDFIGEKIKNQLENAENINPYVDSEDTQRFINILRDIEDFGGHELTGRGMHPITRYKYDHFIQIRTVGVTDVLVKFGVPFFIFMFYLMYRSINQFSRHFNESYLIGLGIFLSLITMLMSEVYFNYPMYWSFLFIHYTVKKNRILK